MQYLDIILSIVAGLAAAIPLVIKLVQYVQAAIKEKNWNQLLDLIMNLMEEADKVNPPADEPIKAEISA